MVMRPTSPSSLVPAPLSQASNNPPYPVSPTDEHPPPFPPPANQQQVYSPDLNSSPAFRLKPRDDVQQEQQQQKLQQQKPQDQLKKDNDDDSDYSDLSDWDKSDDEPEDIPNPLKIGGGKPLPPSANKGALPDALRAGPPAGVPIPKSTQSITPEPTGATSTSWGHVSNSSTGSVPFQTNNPYLRMQPTGQTNFGDESSQSIWGDAPSQAQTYGELVELPTFQTPDTPTNPMMKSSPYDVNPTSSHHELPQEPQHTPPPPPAEPHYAPPQPPTQQLQSDPRPQAQRQQSLDQPPLIAVEAATPLSAHPKTDLGMSGAGNTGIYNSSLDTHERTNDPPANYYQEPPKQTWQEPEAWSNNEIEPRRDNTTAAPAPNAAFGAEQGRHQEEGRFPAQQPPSFTPSSTMPFDEEPAPALPVRPPPQEQEEQPPAMPPRPTNTEQTTSSSALDEQRREHYQIKHIRWFDASSHSVRTSPILTQNINGPCPLLALVNALSLSTPAGVQTEFIETLRTREQVSLGLLLDAVFEELMSGRRGGAARELPDVNALYTFLMGLHTGLNVNPMFVQDPTATDGRSNLIPGLSTRPGGFENTRDMKLYSTFDVPLFHGWLPEPGSDAYIAFERVAKTYDSAMIVQFQLEELDAKLSEGGLSPDEQQLFTDIHAIKEFLDRWQSQLSDHGLRTIREALKPGQVAILFRNDHFSTLYKNPHTNELMTLVTDQGYSSHDEIVWESLVDVNGRGSELYSGDFRAVGNNTNPQRQQHQQPVQSLLDIDDNQGWTTVSSQRRNNHGGATIASNEAAPTSTDHETNRTEQEDHDLALALQLQEEEEDRHRRSLEERRRRGSQGAATSGSSGRRASRTNEQPPAIPPRRSNMQQHRPTGEAAPPPTYEEAAVRPAYHPPQGHPANANTPMQAQGSAYQASNAQGGRRPANRPNMGNPQLPARPGRRQSAGMVGPHGHEDRDKCIVM
ncbi:hypothetical protein BU24DRAFT_425226 [Aaosphaeria arxii CBS 175.79]|uniref:MINDY deubiquitinase domain-containing protein n=1 Tax=Aaosphaeria arxii CBS 175.79 TaxID=1450172 RepID=A0A6A5XIB4_9PLEO|nr:uncharacterized protein BU24DRAFT_425226 [Aaosphaeria arxii CBS 175.79]KAF2012587.1 hypothetical protein BU24DRAFT_425226 [Aaosphaeria arxii CBS 175.79]